MDLQNNIIEPTNRNHRILFTVITILLTAGVVGGSVYYVMSDKESTKGGCGKSDSSVLATCIPSSALKKMEEAKKDEVKTEEKKTESVVKKDLEIRDVDFSKVIKTTPGLSSLGNIMYDDYNSDGKEEALVSRSYDGTGSYVDFYIYGYNGDQLTVYLKLESAENKALFGPKYSGHNWLMLKSNVLEASAPIYEEGDSNCCPSGGKMYVTFKWDGTKYIENNREIKNN